MVEKPMGSPRLASLEKESRRGGRRALESGWDRLVARGLPLVERIPGENAKLRATFAWRPGQRLRSPSIFTSLAGLTESETALHPLGNTGVWYHSFDLTPGARAYYGFSPQPFPGFSAGKGAFPRYIRTVLPDPHNPSRMTMGKDPDDRNDAAVDLSIASLPKAPRMRWSETTGGLHWREAQHRLGSRHLRSQRRVWVYLPSEFDPRRKRYRLVVVFDGVEYSSAIPTPRIVEGLVRANRIPPTVLVLVGHAPHARTKELGANLDFSRFLATELVPWLRRKYRLSTKAEDTVLAGSSLGGLAAAHAALHYPDRFGKVFAQSGAFGFPLSGPGGTPATLMEEFVRTPRHSTEFYLNAGTLETIALPGFPATLLGHARYMRDVLRAKGYRVTYAEFEGAHDYACWRATFADGLIALLGRN